MTVEDLKKAGAIYVEHIRDGLEAYESETVRLSGEQANECFLEKLREYGSGGVFLDFYYFVLDEDARIRIDGLLSEEEKRFLRSMEMEKGTFLFPAMEPLIRIAVKLNEAEMLFSSFYFVEGGGKASIWWGNYGKEYVVMRRDK